MKFHSLQQSWVAPPVLEKSTPSQARLVMNERWLGMARCSRRKEISSKNSPLRGCLVNQWSCSGLGGRSAGGDAAAWVGCPCSALPGSEERSLLRVWGKLRRGEHGDVEPWGICPSSSSEAGWLVHLATWLVSMEGSEMGLWVCRELWSFYKYRKKETAKLNNS